ncbi:hypothetical protein BESB_084040 [Besnoitia besnoiti]|uniref:Protein kinase domain-containing protein n=1 Tax=Besnoitia besnoiti TaxID=94643 RepID=A0A2A9M5G9_BESBE|nr:hypothetical protein BESB_084040 [Besnoitia besnoiti]PFH33205.1 hypothetical protein BESB_084040 [Besnoitia besnoiti]
MEREAREEEEDDVGSAREAASGSGAGAAEAPADEDGDGRTETEEERDSAEAAGDAAEACRRYTLGVTKGRRFRSAHTGAVYQLEDIIGTGSAATVFLCRRVATAVGAETPEARVGARPPKETANEVAAEIGEQEREAAKKAKHVRASRASNGQCRERGEDAEEAAAREDGDSWRTNLADDDLFAVKVLDLKAIKLCSDFSREIEKVHREVRILQALRHPCIVNLEDVVEEKDFLFLVMEYVKGGELFYKVVQKGCFSEPQACFIMHQLVHACIYMHGKNVLHRDLKPENILVSRVLEGDFFVVKVADFGLAKLLTQRSLAHTLVGTPQYWAPEVLACGDGQHRQSYGASADLWSLGVCLYVMLGGSYPFDERVAPIHTLILRGQFHFRHARFQRVSESAKDLVRRLLTVDTLRRITEQDVLKHPWMLRWLNPSDARLLPAGAASPGASFLHMPPLPALESPSPRASFADGSPSSASACAAGEETPVSPPVSASAPAAAVRDGEDARSEAAPDAPERRHEATDRRSRSGGEPPARGAVAASGGVRRQSFADDEDGEAASPPSHRPSLSAHAVSRRGANQPGGGVAAPASASFVLPPFELPVLLPLQLHALLLVQLLLLALRPAPALQAFLERLLRSLHLLQARVRKYVAFIDCTCSSALELLEDVAGLYAEDEPPPSAPALRDGGRDAEAATRAREEEADARERKAAMQDLFACADEWIGAMRKEGEDCGRRYAAVETQVRELIDGIAAMKRREELQGMRALGGAARPSPRVVQPRAGAGGGLQAPGRSRVSSTQADGDVRAKASASPAETRFASQKLNSLTRAASSLASSFSLVAEDYVSATPSRGDTDDGVRVELLSEAEEDRKGDPLAVETPQGGGGATRSEKARNAEDADAEEEGGEEGDAGVCGRAVWRARPAAPGGEYGQRMELLRKHLQRQLKSLVENSFFDDCTACPASPWRDDTPSQAVPPACAEEFATPESGGAQLPTAPSRVRQAEESDAPTAAACRGWVLGRPCDASALTQEILDFLFLSSDAAAVHAKLLAAQQSDMAHQQTETVDAAEASKMLFDFDDAGSSPLASFVSPSFAGGDSQRPVWEFFSQYDARRASAPLPGAREAAAGAPAQKTASRHAEAATGEFSGERPPDAGEAAKLSPPLSLEQTEASAREPVPAAGASGAVASPLSASPSPGARAASASKRMMGPSRALSPQVFFEEKMLVFKLLTKSLDRLRRVDYLLSCIASFWDAFDVVLTRLVQLQQIPKTLLGVRNVSFKRRARERLRLYMAAWAKIQAQCRVYMHLAKQREEKLVEFGLHIQVTADQVDAIHALS